MIERRGDMWRMPADLRVVTTNGMVRRDGACVMGRGVALQAKRHCPGIEYMLGERITTLGNHVHLLPDPNPDASACDVASFPVKHHWRDRADLDLVARSTAELRRLVDEAGYEQVVVPRPGCGNGGRLWAEVRPIVAPLWNDDRFIVVTL